MKVIEASMQTSLDLSSLFLANGVGIVLMLLLTLTNLFTPIIYVYHAVILYILISAIVVMKRYWEEYGARTFFNISMILVPILICDRTSGHVRDEERISSA